MIRKSKVRFGALSALRRHDAGATARWLMAVRIFRACAVFAITIGALLLGRDASAQTTYSWRSESVNGRWDYNDNWWNGSGYQAPQGGDVIRFANGSWLTMTNDLPNTSRYRIYFDSGSGARTIEGSTANTFYDYGGNTPVIQNDSGNTQTINFKIINGNSVGYLDLIANSGNLVFGGDVSASGSGTRQVTVKGAANTLISGKVTQESGAALTLYKEAAGTLTLSGANDYSGTTTIAGGAIVAANNTALGGTGNGTTVSSGAALQLSNNITISNEALTIAGTGISSDGALRSVSGSNAYTGLITASSATTTFGAASGATLVISNVNSGGQEFWIVGDGTTIVAGGATNSGSGTAFVKTNVGTAILSASNAWSGAEYIREGAVVLSNNNALGTGGTTYLGAADAGSSATATITIGSGIINSNAIVVEALGTGARTLSYQTGSGTGTQLGSITLNTNSLAFNIATGGTLLFGGGVTVNTNATSNQRLAVDGGGTLIVTNNGSGISGNERYQVRIGNGTLVIGLGTIISRTNVPAFGHAIDLGVDLSNNIVNATSTLAASNGITVSNSIFVSTTSGAARVLSVAGAGTATYSGPIALNNAGLTVTATNASDNVRITGAITNFTGSTALSNTLTKTGSGTATLSGANTYAGVTTVSGGTLALSGSGSLATTNAVVVTNSGSVFDISGLSGAGTTIGTLAGDGAVALGAKRLTFGRDSTNTTVSGIISGAGGALTKQGNGTITLSGANTYSGGTILNNNGGTILIGNAGQGAVGNITNSSIGTGTLALNGGRLASDSTTARTIYNAVTVGGTTTLGDGTLTGALTFAAGVDLGAATRIIAVDSGVTMLGILSNGGMQKNGSGTLTLSGANTYSGGTILNGGALLIANAGQGAVGNITNSSVGTGTLSLQNNARLASDGATARTIYNAVKLTGGTTLGSATVNTGTLTFAANVDLNNMTNNMFVDSDVTILGIMTNGGFRKQGNGTLTLSGANTYSGDTTNSSGTILIANAGQGAVGNITNSSVGTGKLVLSGGRLASDSTTARTIYNAVTVGGSITLGDGTNTGALTFGANVDLGAGTRTITTDSAVTMSGVMSNGGLVKSGSSTLTLSGANTYSTGTLVSAGMLQIGGGGTSGSLSTSSVITNNATLAFNRSDNISQGTDFSGSAISGTGQVLKLGAGTLTLTASNTYSGGTVVLGGLMALTGSGSLRDSGSLAITNGAFDISAISGSTNTVGALSGDSAARINLGSKAFYVGRDNTNTTFAGVISNTGSLTKQGTGTMILSGASTYSGGTTISNGTLVMSNNSALGTGTVTIGATSNGISPILALGNGITNANAIYVEPSSSQQFYLRTLTVQNSGDTATQLGTVTLSNSQLALNVATNATLIFGAGINVTTGVTNFSRLVADGGGTVIITNNGNVLTNVSTNNTLQVRVGNATMIIGSGAIATRTNIDNHGIDLGTDSLGKETTNTSYLYASNGVTVANSVYVLTSNAATRVLGIAGTGTATYSATISLKNANLSLSAGTGGTVLVSSNIANYQTSTNNGITKIGVGTVILSGTNTYNGTTAVSEGTLAVNGRLASNATTTVTNTGVLSGSGSIAGTTTIAAGGTISPGYSVGTLSVTNMVFGTNGNYNWQLYNATAAAGTGYDTISGAGGLNITANGTDKFNINLWTLSGISPDVNGNALNFLSSSNYSWTLGTWAGGITNFNASYFSINTSATNGTGGFANAFAGTFSLTSSNNSIFLNYAGAAGGPPIYSAGAGTWSTNFTPALYQGAPNWIFDGATGGAATNDIASATINTLGTLTFSNTAGSYTLSAASGSAGYDAASALAITGNIVNNSANAQTINLALGFSNAATINAAAGHMTFGGAISNGTSLTFTGASNNTVSGAIGGAGYLVKDGAGTLVLSGNNTYTGGTLVSTGTLQVGAGGTSGSLSTSALTNNATLAFNRSDNLTASYDISGTGALIKDGAGTLTLSGNNSYGGTTTISNGAISIGVLANAGSNSGIGTNATVTFAGANATNTVLDYTGGNVTTDRTFAFNGTASNGEGGTINMASSNTVITATGSASGTGKMIISEGTLVLSNTSTPNSFAPAAIQVDTGATLALAADNQIGNTTGLILNGGTFRTGTSSTGFSDTLGTLTLSASSTIDLGAWTTGLRTLTFADSSAITWTGTLTITNWQGVAHQSSDVAQILFGTGGLTSTQLGQIVFANQGINGGELIGGGGELVPIPEPRVYAAAIALLAAAGWRERKRLRDLLAPRKQ